MGQINSDALAVLKQCKVTGNNIQLPDMQLDRKLYESIAKELKLIGGSWKGGKISAFVFQSDPTDLLENICGGTSKNLKKEFQFFHTPLVLAHRLVRLAEIKEGMTVLEPSAGQGHLIEAIYHQFPRTMSGPNDEPCVTVDFCELMPQNREVLLKKISENKNWASRTSFMAEDFLEFSTRWKYDRIVANPPFSKNQDIDHIRAMYDSLNPSGILVSIASIHWHTVRMRAKEDDFAQWLHRLGAEIISLPAGEFKEAGTNIETCIVKIIKRT